MKPNRPGKNPDRVLQEEDYISSGFPSPAEDHEEQPLDLHEHVVQNPLATYFLRCDTENMHGAGVNRGDLLVVDRSVSPADLQLVVAVLDEAFQLKRLRKSPGKLHFEDDAETIEGETSAIWGVVTFIVRKM